MPTTILLLSLAALVVWLVVVPQLVLGVGWRREIRQGVTRDRNRDRFGRLRTQLMELAREGDVDIGSELFTTLYKSLTVLMRNPLHYAEAARVILNLPHRRADERAFELSESERALVVAYADALDALCRDHSRTYRMLSSAMPKGAPHLWVILFVQRSPAYRRMEPVREARGRLLEVAGCPAPA